MQASRERTPAFEAVGGRELDVQRRLARSVFGAIVLMATIALAVPLLSFRSDLAEARQELDDRVRREARIHANALALWSDALISVLERIALRPEIRDPTTEDTLDPPPRGAALFTGGIVLLGLDGRVQHGDASGVDATGDFSAQPWFVEVVASGEPRVDAAVGAAPVLVTAVPIFDPSERPRAVLAGFVYGTNFEFPGEGPVMPHVDLVLFGERGQVLAPDVVPAWATPARLEAIAAEPEIEDAALPRAIGGDEHILTVMPVSQTSLSVLLAADAQPLLAPIRTRLRRQLVFLAALQLATLLLFGLHLHRTSRSFLALERRAARHATLVALGGAAALIAHEVRNALNGISAATSLLDGLQSSLPVRSIRTQVVRLKHLATSLLAFTRPPSAQLVTSRVDGLVGDVVASMCALPEAEDVDVVTQLGGPIVARCDPLLLRTALENLVRNAIEASATATDVGARTSARVVVRAGEERHGVVISVDDDAGGPPPEFAARLFEPFVTSKPRGVGLGLVAAQQATAVQGGRLEFTRTSSGSRFTITLPQEVTP